MSLATPATSSEVHTYCELCGRMVKFSDYSIHQKIAHYVRPRPTLACPICKFDWGAHHARYSFKEVVEFQRKHFKRDHYRFVCSSCPAVYASERELKFHFQVKHSLQPEDPKFLESETGAMLLMAVSSKAREANQVRSRNVSIESSMGSLSLSSPPSSPPPHTPTASPIIRPRASVAFGSPSQKRTLYRNVLSVVHTSSSTPSLRRAAGPIRGSERGISGAKPRSSARRIVSESDGGLS
ncbi:hypothetical protein SISSUDRAFT_1121730 [Sistotremastrum suecicum HHB10207 ss-3]|uniref:C2H2-type domain-containing protein n=1 Tax=Sistotremastrum suecicum HHB10207 ss-3 TaxID=1314776 RepID=A0A166ADN4_9AGAM|nr:hypothetical protein SISSUDRAFT_1121730 [Sistotremastrum suecicum HHB10207 ss-3]